MRNDAEGRHRSIKKEMAVRLEMVMFAMLGKWTQMRAENPDKIAETTERTMNVAKSLGIKPVATIYTMGQYDAVGIYDAPNDEAATKFSLAAGKLGAIRLETLRGILVIDGGLLSNMTIRLP